MARVRLADVAREAGVSIGAASDALSGKNQIPESTRQRVRDAAERLGYVPNPVARAMRMGHLPLIGFVIGALRRPDEYLPHRAYWGELIGAATIAAAQRGYGVVILPGLTGSQFDPTPLAGLAVMSSAPGEPDLGLALSLGLPVLTDTPTEHPRAIVADIPYAETVIAACDHLRQRGATRPALMCADIGSNFSIAVIAAYRTWCEEAGVAGLVVDTSHAVEQLGDRLERAFAAGVDAVYSVDGYVPVVMDVAQRTNRMVGTDVLVVELDDDTDGGCTRRDTSNVALALTDFVARLTDVLIDAAATPSRSPVDLRCDFELMPRGSSAGRP